MRSLALLGVLAACGGGPAVWRPDLVCPGDPSGVCPPAPNAPLEVGVATRSIEPACYETWIDHDLDQQRDPGEPFLDCGCDRLCPDHPRWTAPDAGEGDGVFQAVWMAGGANATPVKGVRSPGFGLRGPDDGLWARAVVFRQGETAAALVALDLIGLLHDDVLAIRTAVSARGVPIDHLVVHATHTHAGPDTLGPWGPDRFTSGRDPVYVAQVRDAVVDAVEDAWARAEAAWMVVGAVDASTYEPTQGVANVARDVRDPWVVDPELRAARFVDVRGETITTLVNWSAHPELLRDHNAWMTSGFVHALRLTVERGALWDTARGSGVGGTAVFLNGAVGGRVTDRGVQPIDPDGHQWLSQGWNTQDVLGQLLGDMALDAVRDGEVVPDPRLSFRSASLALPIDNLALRALHARGVIERTTTLGDDAGPITADDVPWVRTEIGLLALGPLQILTMPGEVLPELWVGGYDGALVNAPGHGLLRADNPAPPDLAGAPVGPYWRDRLDAPHRWLLGLANDALGPVIPAYDFVLHPEDPYVLPADGDHDEETMSLGPDTAARLDAAVIRLLEWRSDAP